MSLSATTVLKLYTNTQLNPTAGMKWKKKLANSMKSFAATQVLVKPNSVIVGSLGVND